MPAVLALYVQHRDVTTRTRRKKSFIDFQQLTKLRTKTFRPRPALFLPPLSLTISPTICVRATYRQRYFGPALPVYVEGQILFLCALNHPFFPKVTPCHGQRHGSKIIKAPETLTCHAVTALEGYEPPPLLLAGPAQLRAKGGLAPVSHVQSSETSFPQVSTRLHKLLQASTRLNIFSVAHPL